MEKAYFCFLLEWAETFNLLTESQSGMLIKAMISYEKDGICPEFEDGIIRFAWLSNIKPKMDSLREHYESKVRQASLAGKASAEKRKQKQRTLTDVESDRGNEQTLTDSTNIDLDLVKDIDLVKEKEKIIKKEKPKRHQYGQYKNVLLDDDEIEKLKAEFPADWQERIENVSAYCRSHGKTYKDYLATIRAWARKDNVPKIVPIKKNDVQSGLAQALELLGVQDG